MDYRGVPDQPTPPRGYFVADGAGAIAAAVLAALSGVASAVLAVIAALIVADVSTDEPTDTDGLPDLGPVIVILGGIVAVLCALLALLYLLGAALLFLRLTAGRVLVILGAVLTVPIGVLLFGQEPNPWAAALVLASVAMIILSALPSTARWVAAARLQRQPRR